MTKSSQSQEVTGIHLQPSIQRAKESHFQFACHFMETSLSWHAKNLIGMGIRPRINPWVGEKLL